MKFCTAINCMDGRTQLPVIHYLRDNYNVPFVDMITEPGPNIILTEHQNNPHLVQSILNRVEISISRHNSQLIAIVGHCDCAGNPADCSQQEQHLAASFDFLKSKYPNIEIIKLWVDADWQVREIKQKAKVI